MLTLSRRAGAGALASTLRCTRHVSTDSLPPRYRRLPSLGTKKLDYPLARELPAPTAAPGSMVRLAAALQLDMQVMWTRHRTVEPVGLVLESERIQVEYSPDLLVRLHEAAVRETALRADVLDPAVLRRAETFMHMNVETIRAEAKHHDVVDQQAVLLLLFRALLAPLNVLLTSARKDSLRSCALWDVQPVYERYKDDPAWRNPRRPHTTYAISTSDGSPIAMMLVTGPSALTADDFARIVNGVRDGRLYLGADGRTQADTDPDEDPKRPPQKLRRPISLLDQVKVQFALSGARFIILANGHQFMLAYCRRQPDGSSVVEISPIVEAGAEPMANLLPASPGGLVLALSIVASDFEGSGFE